MEFEKKIVLPAKTTPVKVARLAPYPIYPVARPDLVQLPNTPEEAASSTYPINDIASWERPYIPENDQGVWWDTSDWWAPDAQRPSGTVTGTGAGADVYSNLTAEEKSIVADINTAAIKNKTLTFNVMQNGQKSKRPHKYANQTYSGVDIVPAISIPGQMPYVFGDISTLSVSTHSESFPVRICGRRNPIGFTKGARTIAGSIIFSVLDIYPWYRMAREMWSSSTKSAWDGTSAGDYPLADSLPPFDITVTFANEYESPNSASPSGAVMRIYGVILIDDGMTLSIDDLVTENTFSFMAAGMAPLHNAKDWNLVTGSIQHQSVPYYDAPTVAEDGTQDQTQSVSTDYSETSYTDENGAIV